MAWFINLPEGRQRLSDGRYVVGRDPGCNIVVKSPEVSGRHAELIVRGSELSIRDLGSRNGTFVGGQRLTPDSPARLTTAAQVVFGTTSVSIAPETQAAQQSRPQQLQREEAISPPPDVQDAAARPRQQVQPPPQVIQQVYQPPPSVGYKSYMGTAVLVLVLYWLLYLPGLIANIVYLAEASRYKATTGHSPDGVGCLWALLAFFFLLPIALGVILGIIAAVGILSF